jgi:predicted AlkP superfamily pyrophosphatase or phosphodiesterase
MSEPRPLFAVVATILLAPSMLAAAATPVPAQAGAATPRLLLVVSVDQMRADYLTRFATLYTGGLERLREQGAVFTQARYRHASTETGPGHSVILSSRSPRHSGIVANSWWDDALRRRVNVVDDPTVTVLGGEGRAASPAYFVGFTLGDVLKKRSPGSRVVGVSFKDRAAILMAGPRADAAYWFGNDGRFVTTTYYMPAAPAWLTAWNERRVPDGYGGKLWERLLPDTALYDRLAGPDDVKGESDRQDTVFPHRVRPTPPGLYKDLPRTPFADEILREFALEAAARHELGTRDALDLLAVGFSAGDYVGHTYGPDSHEVMDQLLRFDRTLGGLIEALETRVGAGRVLVVLTADHGVQPLVEVLQARGVAGARRVEPAALRKAAEDALAARFPGKTGLVLDAEEGVTLDLEALARQGLARRDVEDTLAKALVATGVVADVYTHERLMGAAPAGDPYFALYQRAFYAPRSPHLVLRLAERAYVDTYPGGTGHGSPYDHDRHVPIVFMGPGVKAGTHAEPCGPEDIAFSLGKLLGLDYPQQDAEVDLSALVR